MVAEGVETVENVRMRFDGERRNPWDEPECGHHYARAMSAWSSVVAFSGFDYLAARKSVSLMPKAAGAAFKSFWSTASAWGAFSVGAARTELGVTEGSLPVRSITLAQGKAGLVSVALDGRRIPHRAETHGGAVTLTLEEEVVVAAGGKMAVAALDAGPV